MGRNSEHLCAFCSSRVRLPSYKSVGFKHVIGAVLSSGALSWMIWQTFDPRALIFFPLLLGMTELILVLRWRLAIVCKACGFDPALYLKSPEAACERVKNHYEQHKLNPNRLLVSHPLDRMLREKKAYRHKFREKLI